MCYTADSGEDLFLTPVEHYTLNPIEQHCWEQEQYKYVSKNASNVKYLAKPLNAVLLIIDFQIYNRFQKYL